MDLLLCLLRVMITAQLLLIVWDRYELARRSPDTGRTRVGIPTDLCTGSMLTPVYSKVKSGGQSARIADAGCYMARPPFSESISGLPTDRQ